MHACQHRHALVHVVIDEHLRLARVQAVEAAGVLLQCPSPGDRHGEEERVKARVVKALTDAAAGGENDSRRAVPGVAAIASAIARRALLPMPPDMTKTWATDSASVVARRSRWAVRSVSTSGERPVVTAASTSVTISRVAVRVFRKRGVDGLYAGLIVGAGQREGRAPRHDSVVEGSGCGWLRGSVRYLIGPHCMVMIG